MCAKSKSSRKFLRVALITSPILAIYVLLPWYLFTGTIGFSKEFDHWVRMLRFGFSAGWITLFILGMWWVNIFIGRQKALGPKWFRYVLTFGISIGFALLFTMRFKLNPDRFGIFEEFKYISAFTLNAVIIIIIRFLETEEQKSALLLKNSRLEIASLVMREENLKSQIHPHFLFNCLSNLNALISTNQEKAEEYSENLSSFLRKSLSNGKETKITVDRELDLLSHYLILQLVRFEGMIQCQITIPEETKNNKCIPSFALQLLVENAIKHNGLSKSTPLRITIDQVGDFLIVRNNLIPTMDKEEGSGIGLENLSSRYELLADEEVLVTHEKDFFEVRIKLLECE